LINLLCDTALVYGYAEQKRFIDSGLVDDVARDKHKGSVLPLRMIPGDAPAETGFSTQNTSTGNNSIGGPPQVKGKILKK
jgi:hypothetical protein